MVFTGRKNSVVFYKGLIIPIPYTLLIELENDWKRMLKDWLNQGNRYVELDHGSDIMKAGVSYIHQLLSEVDRKLSKCEKKHRIQTLKHMDALLKSDDSTFESDYVRNQSQLSDVTPGGIDFGKIDFQVEGDVVTFPAKQVVIDLENFHGFSFHIVSVERVGSINEFLVSEN